jgi:hypothetical protein
MRGSVSGHTVVRQTDSRRQPGHSDGKSPGTSWKGFPHRLHQKGLPIDHRGTIGIGQTVPQLSQSNSLPRGLATCQMIVASPMLCVPHFGQWVSAIAGIRTVTAAVVSSVCG